MSISESQAQLQMQLLGKGNLSVGKDETASMPAVSTDSSINPLAQSPQPDNSLMASGRKCCGNAPPVSLINLETQIVLHGQVLAGCRSYRKFAAIHFLMSETQASREGFIEMYSCVSSA